MKRLAVLLGLLSAACGAGGTGPTPPAPPPPPPPTPSPGSIAALTPLSQEAAVGQAITISVRVTTAAGNPIAGTAVSFSIVDGGGNAVPGSGITDATGQAMTTWTLGGSTGTNTLSAAVATLTPINFTAVGIAAPSGSAYAKTTISSSDFGSGATRLRSAYGTSFSGVSGQVSVPVSVGGTGLVLVEDSSGRVRGLSLSLVHGAVPNTLFPDALSTAVTLLFLSPSLTTTDSAETQVRLAVMNRSPCVGELARQLRERLPNQPLQAMALDQFIPSMVSACADSIALGLASMSASTMQSDRRALLPTLVSGGGVDARSSLAAGKVRVDLVNNEPRFVDIQRREVSTLSGLDAVSTVAMPMEGAIPLTWGSIATWTAFDPSLLADGTIGPAGPSSIEYWVYGCGGGSGSPAMPPNVAVLETRTRGLELCGKTLISYMIAPIVDFSIGTIRGAKPWITKAQFLWDAVSGATSVSHDAAAFYDAKESKARKTAAIDFGTDAVGTLASTGAFVEAGLLSAPLAAFVAKVFTITGAFLGIASEGWVMPRLLALPPVAKVVVPVPVSSLVVVPSAVNLEVGESAVVGVLMTDGRGNFVFDRPVDWGIDRPTVASIGVSGPVLSPVTGIAPGLATIEARSEGILGRSVVTVVSPRPPPALSRVTTNPAAPVVGIQFSVTVTGSNFNPTTAQIVFTGPGCPSVTSCVVQNNVLTSKSAGSLTGPVILAAGSFNVQVQNGGTGVLSNTGLVAVGSPPASRMQVVSGDAQSGTINTALSQPLVVQVLDPTNKPVSGVQIIFAVAQGGGDVNPMSVGTSALGLAQSVWTLGPNTGPNTATASSVGLTGSPVVFSASGVAALTPTIALDRSVIAFTGVAGQSTPFQVISITNGGTGTLNSLGTGVIGYGAGQPTGWLSPSLNTTAAPAILTLNINTAGLPAGSYGATVPVMSAAAGVTNSPQSVTVTLTLSSASTPTIGVNPNSANFTATAGGATPPPQSIIQVTNVGSGGTLRGLAIGTVTYATSQPTGWLTSASLASSTAPTILTLGVTLGGLGAGTYTATAAITSTAPGVTNSPRTVTVTFAVAPAVTTGALRLSVSGLPSGFYSRADILGPVGPLAGPYYVYPGSPTMINSLVPGLYTLTWTNAICTFQGGCGPVSYGPSTTTQQVSVPASTTPLGVTTTYVPITGILNLTVSGLPNVGDYAQASVSGPDGPLGGGQFFTTRQGDPPLALTNLTAGTYTVTWVDRTIGGITYRAPQSIVLVPASVVPVTAIGAYR